jgi:membrane associated rhomboid family serine protease
MRPPESWRRARVTLAIAAVTAAAWLIVSGLGWTDPVAVLGGFIPARIGLDGAEGGVPVWLTPLTATLIHGNLIHIAFNLLIFLFCGRPVENIIGGTGMLILYLVGAYASAAGQYIAGPDVDVPMIGASGAVSAVIGAYALMFGRNRVKIANPQLALWANAFWLAAAWIGLQLLIGFTFRSQGPLVAIGAHIGGFLVGLLLVKPLLLLRWRKA